MGLDQVKTQVLLLHSQQSTLDRLSAGIDDSYTVHCATSGMEALTTLGVTPIHVIISAKDLPGMSGVDALREAKKRSPETIGILMANNGDADLEALVGEKEVFQVVRNLKPADLGRIIDNATQQIRLLALTHSANDGSANLDQSAPAEHIIMETSENGSTIISDSTGRMRALNPSRISEASAAGARAVDVLALSKDEEFLATVKDSTAGMQNIRTANTLAQAEDLLAKYKIGVAIVDAAMVGQNAEKLTQHLQRKSARLVSIVAGRRDDGDMLMDLINRGKVYRFLLKPVSPGRARLAIEASVKQHLEAPDSAFKVSSAAPTTTAPADPAPMVAQKAPAPKPEPTAAPTPAAATNTKAPTADDRLSDAFGEDDKSFTETVTGLVTNVGERLSSSQRTKTPVSLAVDIDSGDSNSDSSSKGPLLLGVGAVVAVALAAGAFFMFSGSGDVAETATTDEPPAVVEERPAPVRQPEPEPVQQTVAAEPEVVETPNATEDSQVIELVDAARLARGTGRVFLPAGNNAIEYYNDALSLNPDDTSIAAELADTITEALSMAEQALLDRRIDDAAAAIQRVGVTDSDNARLPFLSAQLAQLQLREYLDTARAATRSGRFERASQALSEARALGLGDSAEIDAAAAELRAARSEERVDDVLALAVERFDSGSLISPDSDNARYYYSLVLDSEPDNSAAVQGLKAVAAALVVRARNAIDVDQYDEAAALLEQARTLDPGNEELAASSLALTAALAPEPEIAPAATSAVEQQPATNQTTESGESAAAAQPPSSEPEIVGISALNRTRYVAPRYPRAAERRNTSGWVDVVFTVTLDGSVRNVEVRKSEPEEIFDASAIRAVERWEFEPVFEEGVAVEKRAGVRLMFAIE